jgi:hypothetical protein
MATLWLTYSWDDNKSRDVDYLAQELESVGLTVKLDRWNLQAGRRLWEQIADFIQSPEQSDCWAIYATQASLGSEPCQEEFAYALDRALSSRGQAYPVIGIFAGPVDHSLIPAGIRTRLFVSTTDPDWKERIVAAAEGRAADISHSQVQPYEVKLHRDGDQWFIEMRPRAGTWSPFFAAIPATEAAEVEPDLSTAPQGRPIRGGALFSWHQGPSQDGRWLIIGAANEATPTLSYFLHCRNIPSRIAFGIRGGASYEVALI